jgi:hypothetical protein
MADEQAPPVAEVPPIGTASIRRTVAMARSSAGAGIQSPALPPDQASSPWMGPTPPEPDNITTPREQIRQRSRRDTRPPLPEEFTGPPPRAPRKGSAGAISLQQRRAWALVERLLEKWAEESEGNVGKANIRLSRRLAKNGVVLLREGIPMGSVSDLIRLCNELARVQQGDGEEEDERITKMQAALHREIPELEQDPDPEPEGEEENGA